MGRLKSGSKFKRKQGGRIYEFNGYNLLYEDRIITTEFTLEYLLTFDFELIEENTIDEIEQINNYDTNLIKHINKINELVQTVNKLNKEIQELRGTSNANVTNKKEMV